MSPSGRRTKPIAKTEFGDRLTYSAPSASPTALNTLRRNAFNDVVADGLVATSSQLFRTAGLGALGNQPAGARWGSVA